MIRTSAGLVLDWYFAATCVLAAAAAAPAQAADPAWIKPAGEAHSE